MSDNMLINIILTSIKAMPVEQIADNICKFIVSQTKNKVDDELYNKLFDKALIFVKTQFTEEKDINDKVAAICRFIGELGIASADIIEQVRPFGKKEIKQVDG